MFVLNLMLAFLFQAPAPAPASQNVVVGLDGGKLLVLENPQFSGFIQGRNSDAVLTYRQRNLHGAIALRAISRIEFGAYRKGRPFELTVTLKNGQKLEV